MFFAGLLLWMIAAWLGLSAAFHFNSEEAGKDHVARELLQFPVGVRPLATPAAETCSGGETLTQTSTATTVITVTPSLETTTTTVTATAATATSTYTETTTQVVSTASTSTSTASSTVTQTSSMTCVQSPGTVTTVPPVCITTTTTRTVTDSITLTASTATSTDTTTVTPSTSTTKTSTSTVLVISTTTTTITPPAATSSVGVVSPTGLKYYDYYPRIYKSGSSFFANVPAIVNGLSNNSAYNLTGSVRNINALASSNNQITFPDGQAGPGESFALILQGYLYPALGAGTYKLSSRDQRIDDVGIVWAGDKALGNNWSYSNFDYGAEWPTTGRQLPTSGSVSLNLGKDEVVALTIFWANTAGPGTADFVVDFGGSTYTNTSQFFVGPCDGSGLFKP